MDLLRMAIVYPHLIACCVAIGLVLTSDIALIRQLINGHSPTQHDDQHMASLQKTVSLALIALWITGISIIALDMSSKGWSYLMNPKLQAKILIVTLLTFNGFILHSTVIPAMKKVGSLLDLALSQRLLALFSGVISGVSWFYAAMLGIGRPLNWKYSLLEILLAYPLLIAAGFVSMLALTAWAKQRHQSVFAQPLRPAHK